MNNYVVFLILYRERAIFLYIEKTRTRSRSRYEICEFLLVRTAIMAEKLICILIPFGPESPLGPAGPSLPSLPSRPGIKQMFIFFFCALNWKLFH